MTRSYDVIDADGHVLEPPQFWRDYIDPDFRDRAPTLVVDDRGRTRLRVEDHFVGNPQGIGMIGSIGHQHSSKTITSFRYEEGRPGGFDPHARIKDMDLDGIDAAFLYPSIGLYAGAISDADLAAACCRAYNRWIVEYCAPYPDRLFPVAMLPMQSPERAKEELLYARSQLRFRSGFVRPNQYAGRNLGHPDYDILWAAAQDLDFPIGIHEGSGGMPSSVADRFQSPGARHICTHTIEMMLACLSVIWEGVCERYPSLRFAFLESGGGWVPAWLDRMDRHYANKGIFDDAPITMKPSEYFQRQCWISFEPSEGSLGHLVDYIGPTKILWATDYPHVDGFFPGAPQMIANQLSEDDRPKVLGLGARRFYGI
jgi:predicted TIM-barrel fold metal-dependent hydrolase